MKKKHIKAGVCIFAGLVSILVFLQLVSVSPLLFPNRYFDHSYTYGPLEVHDQMPKDSTTLALLKEVVDGLNHIPLYSGGKLSIYLCRTEGVYQRLAVLAKKSPYSQGFHLHPLGYNIISLKNIENTSYHNEGKHRFNILEGSPKHVILHEITHGLIEDRIGWWRTRKLAFWKAEGYCEYAAGMTARMGQREYRFFDRLDHFYNEAYRKINPERRRYAQAALVVEYLMDIRNLSFDQLVDGAHCYPCLIDEMRK